MSLFKPESLGPDDLPHALALLSPGDCGIDAASALKLWKKWHAMDALSIGWVRAMGEPTTHAVKTLGVTLWITNHAAASIRHGGVGSAAQQLYRACSADPASPAWVMDKAQILKAHKAQKLNLLVLHFWTRMLPTDDEFLPIFVITTRQFQELHQGFGIQQALQEVAAFELPFVDPMGLSAISRAGQVPDLHQPPELQRVLVGVDRSELTSKKSGAVALLLVSPPSRLMLRETAQRLLGLALKEHTDEEIAAILGCRRDSLRPVWDSIYAALENASVNLLTSELREKDASANISGQSPALTLAAAPVRGRERRRLALAFFRHNLQELRPGFR